jgi:hypothetical protein
MTRSEFEELIGRKANDEEYALADAVYLYSGFNKNEFCAIWKATGDKVLFQSLLDEIKRNKELMAGLKSSVEIAVRRLVSILQGLSPLSDKYEVICRAIETLVGTPILIMLKLKNKICLSNSDIAYIEMHMDLKNPMYEYQK